MTRALIAALVLAGSISFVILNHEGPSIGSEAAEVGFGDDEGSLRHARGLEAWQVLASRHYGAYEPDALKKLGIQVSWVGALIFIGKYQGTYEECGCSSGQTGGHPWEAIARQAIERYLAEDVKTIAVGANVVDPRSLTAPGIGHVYRVRNATYLLDYFERTGVCLWAVDSRDAGYISNDCVRAPTLLWPGTSAEFKMGALRTGLDLLDASRSSAHQRSASDHSSDFRVLVLQGQAPPDVSVEETLRKYDLVVDVDSLLRHTRDSSLVDWGRGLGTTLAVLRLARLSGPATSGDGSGSRAFDLRQLRSFVSLARRNHLERLPDDMCAGSSVAFDWWQVDVGHFGKTDRASTEALGRLQEDRVRLLQSERVSLLPPRDVQCGRCHAKQGKQWARGPHHRAFATLREKGKKNDPSCLRCHSTRFRQGWQGDMSLGVTCASCHGVHGEGGREHQCARGHAVTKSTCTSCHNGFASPEFDFDRYSARVRCLHEE
jgi:hypothetical protein